MSLKSSLMSREEAEYDVHSIELDMTDETSRLRKRMECEELLYFHNLPTEKVRTFKGDILVAIQGDRDKKKSTMVTLHDIGQNHISCFQSFFSFHQMKPLLNSFTVFHLNFPGQEEGAPELPQHYVYPTMEEMAEVVKEVFAYYDLKNTVCFGVGAGANVFPRLALTNSKLIDCLIMINGTACTSSWSDWGYEKMLSHYLKSKGMTQFCEDYLLYHYFGKIDEHTNHDLVTLVRDDLKRISHARNLALFVEQFSRRSVIKISRTGLSGTQILKSDVLLFTGDRSPMLDDTIDLNSKLDPEKSTWIKISDASSMVLEEQPTHVTNAIILFLQGHGIALKIRPPALPVTEDVEIHTPPAIC